MRVGPHYLHHARDVQSATPASRDDFTHPVIRIILSVVEDVGAVMGNFPRTVKGVLYSHAGR